MRYGDAIVSWGGDAMRQGKKTAKVASRNKDLKRERVKGATTTKKVGE